MIKLKSHGMGVNIATWIQNWLTDRKQRVSVEGETSAWTAVHSGAPQGSVLGPLLFLIYINDLEDGVASNILKFADDTQNFRRVQTRQECRTLQEDLNRLEEWSAKWQMLLNQSKYKCLHIGRANGKEPYEMHKTVLLKNFKGKGSRGDNKCRMESVGTMWNCSQKGESATRDDQDNNNI